VTGERAALWSDACEAAAGIAATFHSATAFIGHINEMSAKSSTSESDGISISTIHSSKGLEWRHIFLAGAEATLMPHHRSEDQEEERRLFYVAITRSKGAVDITFSKFRFGKSQTPSPYLAEISKAPTGAVIWTGGENYSEKSQPPSKDTPQKIEQPAQLNAMPKVYRRRGGKSLIPPEER
jgi:DNA helicase-2/ATP-dependent DNA helicase PcrA